MLVLLAFGSTSGASPHPPPTVVYRFGVVGNRGALTQLQLNRPTPVQGIKGRIVQVATSNSDGYALTSSGAVWAWGWPVTGSSATGRTLRIPPRRSRSSSPPCQPVCGSWRWLTRCHSTVPLPLTRRATSGAGGSMPWVIYASPVLPSSNPKNSRWAMSRWPQGRGHIHSSLREARSTPAAAVSTGFLARARPPAAQHLSASSVCRTRRV